MNIIRKKLSATEITPSTFRISPTTGIFQTTPDDGTTWIDTPTTDPRHNDGFRAPVRTGSQPACDGAHNARILFKAHMDALIGGLGLIESLNAFLVVLVVPVPLFGWIIAGILAGVEGLLIAGTATLNSAMTTSVYNQFEQILFCDASADGHFTAAQFAKVKTDVTAKIGGSAATYINELLDLWGEVGLSNAAAQGAAVGSCGSYSCGWCFEFDLTTSATWTDLTINAGTFTLGSGLAVVTLGTPYNQRWASVTITIPTGGVVTSVQLDYNVTHAGSGPVSVFIDAPLTTQTPTIGGGLGSNTWSTVGGGSSIGLQVVPSRFNDFSGTGFMTHVILRGTGTNPFGADNC